MLLLVFLTTVTFLLLMSGRVSRWLGVTRLLLLVFLATVTFLLLMSNYLTKGEHKHKDGKQERTYVSIQGPGSKSDSLN